MKNNHTSKAVKRVTALVMAAGMMISGAAAVMAEEYDIYYGAITVTGGENGNHVSQPDNPEVNEKDDYTEVVIKGSTNTNTITVDAGAEVTLEGINARVNGAEGKPALAVTGTGEAATVTLKGAEIGILNGSNSSI